MRAGHGSARPCWVGQAGLGGREGRGGAAPQEQGYVWLNSVTRKEPGGGQHRLRRGRCRKPVQCDARRAHPGVVEVVVVQTCRTPRPTEDKGWTEPARL